MLIELPWLENPESTFIWHTEHGIAVSTLLGLISSAYRDLFQGRLNQQPQTAEPKLYHWATGPYRSEVFATTDQSWPGSISNKGILRIPQNFSFTGARPPDYSVSYPGD